ncbi:hypothetical protein ACFYOY_39900 [Streptomyces sp. NPDC007875]
MSDARAATGPQKTTKAAPLRRAGDSHINCWRSGANVRGTA